LTIEGPTGLDAGELGDGRLRTAPVLKLGRIGNAFRLIAGLGRHRSIEEARKLKFAEV
jgi:hypothetical protein